MSNGCFQRQVYCLVGLPFDAVDMQQAVFLLRKAVNDRTPCFLSTPNLNFLIASQTDAVFRDSVINSDLNVVDGMPLVWMARLLGIPIRERTAGSSLFEALDQRHDSDHKKLKVYFFGGPDGVAEMACRALESRDSGVTCVGFQSPGFVSVDDMSEQVRIDDINASDADFVVVALGARKGQAWIERNRSRINAPVISHLGAVVNFVAGRVSRAPLWMQRMGLEWLWRILQEPGLWRRYWSDGLAFVSLLVRQILPYALWLKLNRHKLEQAESRFGVTLSMEPRYCRVAIVGAVAGSVPQALRDAMLTASQSGREVLVDFAGAQYLGPGLFGLLLVMRKRLGESGLSMKMANVSPQLLRQFRWNGVNFLL